MKLNADYFDNIDASPGSGGHGANDDADVDQPQVGCDNGLAEGGAAGTNGTDSGLKIGGGGGGGGGASNFPGGTGGAGAAGGNGNNAGAGTSGSNGSVGVGFGAGGGGGGGAGTDTVGTRLGGNGGDGASGFIQVTWIE